MMTGFSLDDLDAFLSKSDFDFSTVEGWESFIAERRLGGAGRDSDGIQIRDIKNYAVGTVDYHCFEDPVRAAFTIRGLGANRMPPGLLYIYYPDAGSNYMVEKVFLSPTTASVDFALDIGGGGTEFSPKWGAVYYIAIKSDDLPGVGAAEMLGKRVLKQAVRSGGWLLRRGFGLLALGGAGYDVTVRIGNGAPMRNTFMDQEILSDEAMDRIRETASEAWDYLSE